jgi:hypothetical protein
MGLWPAKCSTVIVLQTGKHSGLWIILERRFAMAVCNGTTYHDETPLEVVNEIETARIVRNWRVGSSRLRIFYGDTETGRDWGEEWNIMGYIGRSYGPSKIPLLINNSRSAGGGGLLDHCIVRIIDVHTKRELYRHPKYHHADYRIGGLEPGLPPEYTTSVYHKFDGEQWSNVANFRDYSRAVAYVEFMTGKRMRRW